MTVLDKTLKCPMTNIYIQYRLYFYYLRKKSQKNVNFNNFLKFLQGVENNFIYSIKRL